MGVGLMGGLRVEYGVWARRPGQPGDRRFGGVDVDPDVLRELLSSKAKHGQPVSLVCGGLAEWFFETVDFHTKFVFSDSP